MGMNYQLWNTDGLGMGMKIHQSQLFLPTKALHCDAAAVAQDVQVAVSLLAILPQKICRKGKRQKVVALKAWT